MFLRRWKAPLVFVYCEGQNPPVLMRNTRPVLALWRPSRIVLGPPVSVSPSLVAAVWASSLAPRFWVPAPAAPVPSCAVDHSAIGAANDSFRNETGS